MGIIESAKQLCLERDAFKCITCGSSDNINAVKLTNRYGEISWHLSNLITLCDDCYAKKIVLEGNEDKGLLGVLLCGGKGSRLYPITKYCSKHLLPIGLVAMSVYPIRTLQKMGIKRVVIVIDQASYNITDVLGSGKAFGMEFSYKVQDGAFGIADALSLAKNNARPNDKIVCILGDNIFDNESLKLPENNNACVWLKEVDNPQAYGIATIENNKVVKIVEKPDNPETNLAVVGLYMYPYEVFDVISEIEPSERGELEISTVNQIFAEKDKLDYQIVKGYWGDAGGSLQRYAECSMYGAKHSKISAQEIDNFRSIVFDDK